MATLVAMATVHENIQMTFPMNLPQALDGNFVKVLYIIKFQLV